MIPAYPRIMACSTVETCLETLATEGINTAGVQGLTCVVEI
ncbi:hypothetical protein ASAP_1347 [Asaia bogorensis]|uniref:Uncharacterized protein n=1 Tax=Asaia bogorensis TaxID=91915 RepID=A0A060QKE2_9PROT|nr:hypothetical protein ASAP_1347 [Asaia bogorensis]